MSARMSSTSQIRKKSNETILISKSNEDQKQAESWRGGMQDNQFYYEQHHPHQLHGRTFWLVKDWVEREKQSLPIPGLVQSGAGRVRWNALGVEGDISALD